MAWAYKKDVREVDKEYQQLIDAGWTPVANPDGKTYSWVKGNQVYRGKNDPTPGIDVEANALDWFKRGRRQRRLMSEKVTAMLPLTRDPKTGDTPIPGTNDGTTTPKPGDNTTEKPKEKTAEELAEELKKLKSETTAPARIAVPKIAAPLGPDPNVGLRPGPQQPEQKKKSDKMAGREVPVWEDPDMHMSRLVYVPDDSEEAYNELSIQNGKLGVRRGIVGVMPVSQSEVDWYNGTASDIAPALPGSGMHKLGDKYYPPRIILPDGRKATLKWNPTFIPGRFNTKEEAKNWATGGWGRERPIAQFGDEYGVGTNMWDKVNVGIGTLDWTADWLLKGMGLSPEAIGSTASGVIKAGEKGKSLLQKGKSLIQKGKQLIKRGKGATKSSGQAAKAAETVVEKPMGQLQINPSGPRTKMGGYPGSPVVEPPVTGTPTTTINFTPDGVVRPPAQLPSSRLAPRALTETIPGSPRAITQGQVAIEGPRPMPGGPARVFTPENPGGAIPMKGGPARTSTGAIPMETKPITKPAPRSSSRKVNKPKLKPRNASTKKKKGGK